MLKTVHMRTLCSRMLLASTESIRHVMTQFVLSGEEDMTKPAAETITSEALQNLVTRFVGHTTNQSGSGFVPMRYLR